MKWQRSSFTIDNPKDYNCVEVKQVPAGGALVRNSRDQNGIVLCFTAGEMDAFVRGVKAGEFDQIGRAHV